MYVIMKITTLVVILMQMSGQCIEATNMYNVFTGREDYVDGCGALHPPGNIDAVLITGSLIGTYNTVGSQIQFTCDPGYRLIGSPVIECMSTGEYNPPVPHCEHANGKCISVEHQLPDNTQLSLITNANSVGSIVTYTCADGYAPHKSYQMVCSESYWWRPRTEVPSCEPVTCRLPKSENGHYILNDPVRCSVDYSQYARYQCDIFLICNDGYRLTFQTSRKCTARNTWSNSHLKCVRTQCSMQSGLLNGYYSYPNQSALHIPASFDYGTTLHIFCKHGYFLRGQNTTRCQSSGYWSNANPYCDIVHCNWPSNTDQTLHYTLQNGVMFVAGQANFNTTIYVSCAKGYSLNTGSYTRTCLANGEWSGEPNRCTVVHCPLPDNNGYIFTTSGNSTAMYSQSDIQRLPFNTQLNVSCTENTLFSGKEVRCTENGTWDNNFPQCTSTSISEKATSGNSAVIGGVVGTVVVLVVAGAIVAFVVLYRKRFSDKILRNGTGRRPQRPTSVPPRRVTGHQQISILDENYVDMAESSFNDTNSAQYADYADVPTEFDTTAIDIRDDDEAYYAFDLNKMPSTAILVHDLSDYVLRDDNVKPKLETQFAKLSKEMMFECNEARKSINRGKNRYRNIYPYDETRVVLERTDPNQSDYINASYIHGYNKVNAYIAAQAPLIETLTDWWSMICQTGTTTIVMLTNLVELGKEKCDQYWPDEQSCVYGDVVVTMKRIEEFSEFVIRTFVMKKHDTERTVTQFHFIAWPDKGVPKYASSLVQFRNKVHFGTSHNESPILVHCSAGIGRTGTFIALDVLTEQAHTVGYVDVVGTVETLRKQRVKIVQNPEQYVFLHYAMIETLMLTTSALPAARFQQAYGRLLQLDALQKKRKLDIEFETLALLSPVTDEHQYVTAKQVRNRRKNRHSHILPVGDLMPRIASDDDYINAVFLPSYKEKNAFIITQTPLETTIEDFWNVVINNNVYTIVMMNSAEETTASERYWPQQGETCTFGKVQVTTRNTGNITGHHVRTIDILSHDERRTIKQVQCNGWSRGKHLPDSPHVILTLIDIVQEWQQQTGNQPIAVHCMNGADKSGLFCVISAAIERMKIEQDVAITHVIEEMRNAREQIIPSVEQYQFCHEVVLAYIQQNATYSNFTLC